MASDIRTELILRLPNLTAEQAATVAGPLRRLAIRLGGSLSATERDHHADHAMHVRRRQIVKRGAA